MFSTFSSKRHSSFRLRAVNYFTARAFFLGFQEYAQRNFLYCHNGFPFFRSQLAQFLLPIYIYGAMITVFNFFREVCFHEKDNHHCGNDRRLA